MKRTHHRPVHSTLGLLIPVSLTLALALTTGTCVPMPGDPGEPCHTKFGCGDLTVCVPRDGVGVCVLVVEVCGKDCEAGQHCDPETKKCVTPVTVCSEGETRACGTCQDGLETCHDGQWEACEGASAGVEIPCDNNDNDCDGVADEDSCSGSYALSCDTGRGLCQSTDDGSCGYLARGPEDGSAARMCLVSGGNFQLGEPAQQTSLDTFLLDRDEVTNARYLAYYLALNSSPTMQHQALPTCSPDSLGKSWTETAPYHPNGLADHPVTCVSESQAAAFCLWAGKRLPVEKEWEAAAAGENGLTFPWGDSFINGRANCMDASCHDVYTLDTCVQGLTTCPDTAPVERLSEAPVDGRSPFGLTHMAGNVAEWTAAIGANAAAKGGSFDDVSATLRHWERDWRLADAELPTIGFRCALTPPLGQ
ncbi:MAG: SUMF1/EgtB/PvdO family nonheme iron enzyme [Pseudomonadota bacterium]